MIQEEIILKGSLGAELPQLHKHAEALVALAEEMQHTRAARRKAREDRLWQEEQRREEAERSRSEREREEARAAWEHKSQVADGSAGLLQGLTGAFRYLLGVGAHDAEDKQNRYVFFLLIDSQYSQ